MKRISFFICACTTIFAMVSCNGASSNSGQNDIPVEVNRTYEQSMSNHSERVLSEEDKQYINNSLSTGATPYQGNSVRGNDSKISVRTSSDTTSDVVVIIKSNGTIVRNAYIVAGGTYSFNLPNGTYQVFFYGGKGWNPNKDMEDGQFGGFVANESYSKDDPVTLEYQELEYELILRADGNFSTKPSDKSEIF